jgi:hypothetical protein
MNYVQENMFLQFLSDLDNPIVYSVKDTSHWRAPILTSSARRISYKIYDVEIFKNILSKGTVQLKTSVRWSGDKEAEEHEVGKNPQVLVKSLCENIMKVYLQESLK